MKAGELQAHFRSLNGGWLDPDNTVDTFKAGDPDSEIEGIAVGWMSYTRALKKAVELGCNVFVTHEPTYYDHLDADDSVFRRPAAREKKAFIEKHGLVILRCHDLWDRMPEIGIADTWAAYLDLGEPLASQGIFSVFDVNGRTAGDVARHVAEKTRPLGQEAVQLIGDPHRPVSRACTGVGAGTPYGTFIDEYEADLAICSHDGITYWRDGAFAIDSGIPIIVVNHPVSEEPGVAALARHLAETFPDISVHHVPQRCMYSLVKG
jgi:putative NIF3 family GTP cyclohydrolase 1 type 2